MKRTKTIKNEKGEEVEVKVDISPEEAAKLSEADE